MQKNPLFSLSSLIVVCGLPLACGVSKQTYKRIHGDAILGHETFFGPSLRAFETDTEPSADYVASYVWTIAPDAHTQKDVLTRRTCTGLTDVDSDAYLRCEGAAVPVAGVAEFTQALAAWAPKNNVSTDDIASFITKLSQSKFVYKIRKHNIFGQANALRERFTDAERAIAAFMQSYRPAERQCEE